MKRWSLFILAVLMILAFTPGEVAAQRRKKKRKADTSWKKEFKKKYADYDTNRRREAIEEFLAPEDKDKFEMILQKVLKDPDWFVRKLGQERIGQVESEERLEEAVEALKKEKDFKIREGIIVGLGLRGDPAYIQVIAEALQDDKTHVRVSAARALGMIEDKGTIEPLLEAMKEKDQKYRVFLAIRTSLENLTGRYLGNAPQDWRNWWEGHKENFELGEEADEEEIEKAEEAGHKLKDEQKTVAGVRLNFKVKGLGAPLIVLPEFSFNGNYMEEYLTPLADTVRIYFCDLPTFSAYEDLKRGQGDYVVYPVDQLCKAFKAWMDENKQKRIGILADQQSCWIAMRFATLYPQHLSQMILMSPTSGKDAGLKATERCVTDGQKRNNPDLEHHAQSHILRGGNPVYQVSGHEERQKFLRMHFTLWWGGQFDSSIGVRYGNIHRQMNDIGAPGTIFSDFELGKEKKASVPTLIIWGRRTPRFSPQDMKKIQKFYRNSTSHVFQKTAHLPFIEEHEEFIKLVRSFIKKSRKG